jgi:mannose-6-phosphate isomerase-like protein (cupin superfamily)
MLGGRYNMLVTGADSAGALAVLDVLTPAAAAPPPHVHANEDEAFVLLEGRVTVVIAGEERQLGPGDAALAPRGVPHSFRVESKEPARMIVSCAPAGFDAFVVALGEPARSPGLPSEAPGPIDFERVARIAGEHGISFVAPG